MKRRIQNWIVIVAPATYHALRATDGHILATANRLSERSIAWEWRCVLDDCPGIQGTLVATDELSMYEAVESTLVRAGICTDRVLA